MAKGEIVLDKPIYVVGDVHGRYDELRELLKNVEPKIADGSAKIVFLGDYSGYGLHAMRVMRYLAQLKERFPENVVLLAGNWEDMLYDALFRFDVHSEQILRSRGAGSFVMWLRSRPDAMAFVEKFADGLSLAHSDGEYVFSHAGVSDDAFLCKDGKSAIHKSSPFDLLWRFDFFDANKDRTAALKFVVGHVPIQILSERYCGEKNPEPKPFYSDSIIVADFGSSRNKGFLGYVLFNPDGSRRFKVVPVVPVSKKKR